jgi:hypothetical protein
VMESGGGRGGGGAGVSFGVEGLVQSVGAELNEIAAGDDLEVRAGPKHRQKADRGGLRPAADEQP